jgi:hypothetical protein
MLMLQNMKWHLLYCMLRAPRCPVMLRVTEHKVTHICYAILHNLKLQIECCTFQKPDMTYAMLYSTYYAGPEVTYGVLYVSGAEVSYAMLYVSGAEVTYDMLYDAGPEAHVGEGDDEQGGAGGA